MERARTLLNAVNKYFDTAETMIKWLKALVGDIESHQKAVRISKTTAASVGILSTVLLFTPLAPLGVAGIAGSAITGVGTSIGDIIRTKLDSSKITTKVEEMKSDEKVLITLLGVLGNDIKAEVKRSGVSDEIAVGILLGGIVPTGGIVLAGGGIMLIAGATVILSGKLAVDGAITGKVALDLARISATSIKTATSLSGMAGSMSELVVRGAQAVTGAARVGVGAVGVASGALAGVGAVIGVADAVWTWKHNNPNLDTTKALIKQLVDCVAELVELKSSLERICN
ncbi:hypothetical protein LOD99_3623 [Oopsacas minuta]|uniref:Uncharacterized protein n=1 Tax=Oopsacas minuta TaxID=111878 RepID=A0AAV7JY56_9METZ|nr:hypothetical protein LOD99_3623 [Oopsacas minuta]